MSKNLVLDLLPSRAANEVLEHLFTHNKYRAVKAVQLWCSFDLVAANKVIDDIIQARAVPLSESSGITVAINTCLKRGWTI